MKSAVPASAAHVRRGAEGDRRQQVRVAEELRRAPRDGLHDQQVVPDGQVRAMGLDGGERQDRGVRARALDLERRRARVAAPAPIAHGPQSEPARRAGAAIGASAGGAPRP